MSLLANHGLFSSGNGFTAEYQAVIDRATALGYTLPSAAQQAKQNSFVAALKAAGIWTQLRSLFVWKNAGNQSFGSIDWITPSRLATYSGTGLSITDKDGIGCDGVSGLVNTNYSTTNGQHLAMAQFAYCGLGITFTGSPSFAVVWGFQGAVFDGFWPKFSGNNVLCSCQTSGSPLYSASSFTAAGLSLIQKKSSAQPHLIQNGSDKGNPSAATNGFDGTTVKLFARALGDLQAVNSPIAFWGSANDLNGLESALKTACDNFYAS